MTKELIILGSTGSIGTQALEVAKQQNIKVTALAAGSNIHLLEKQAREFLPDIVSVANEDAAKKLRLNLADTNIKVVGGKDSVKELVHHKGDTVLNAVVGIAGLPASLETAKCGKILALANKESLVTGGNLLTKAIKDNNAVMYPVDSEHSAIFQSLQGVPNGFLSRILLTASGGPFFGKTREELKNVTVEQTLKHPNWSMGQKITVDSATLMNKGLEVIEAVHLFDITANEIDVVVQRESIIHSGVELTDGGLIVQMGVPDMKLPIAYALTYPNRYPCSERLDLTKIGKLTFFKPDTNTFKCLKVCVDAINKGGLKPCAANGANEEAVKLFLQKKISFLQIGDLVEAATNAQKEVESYTLQDVYLCDKTAREFVLNNYNK